jgi:hypothetical protein
VVGDITQRPPQLRVGDTRPLLELFAQRSRTLPIVACGVLMGMLSRRDVRCGVARRELTSANVGARRSEGIGHPHGPATGY